MAKMIRISSIRTEELKKVEFLRTRAKEKHKNDCL